MAEGKKDAKKQIPLRLSAKLYAAIAAWAISVVQTLI